MKGPLSFVVGDGTRHAVRCRALDCGEDWTVAVTGGETPHVGALTLAGYDAAGRVCHETFLLPGHRDDAVSEEWACALSEALGCRVCVTAGLHVDNAAAEDIAVLLENSRECLRQFLAAAAAENHAASPD